MLPSYVPSRSIHVCELCMSRKKITVIVPKLCFRIEREEMFKYGSDKGVYIRNHTTHVDSTTADVFYAPTLPDGYGAPFKAKPGSSWLDAEEFVLA